jgi:hypothetical protein
MRGLWKLDLLWLPHAVLRRIILRLLLCLPCSASRSTSPAWNAKRSERRLVRIYSPEGRVLNRSPHSGHSICSKATRRILVREIEHHTRGILAALVERTISSKLTRLISAG